MKPVYELKDLKQHYSAKKVVHISEMKIGHGEILGIVGPNGSGKSTLLRLLAFLERQSGGEIFFKSQKVQEVDHFRKEVSLLLQNSFLLKRSVFENVAYGLKIRAFPMNEIVSKVRETLQWVGLDPEVFSQRQWYELSGGERQRIALASRLAIRPSVLILDEPTASVDQKSEELIKNAVFRAQEEWNTTIVLVSHDYQWLQGICNRIITMNLGEIVSEGHVNTFRGPWLQSEEEGLFALSLPGGEQIFALGPMDGNGTAVLSPSDVILASECPDHISTRNCLKGVIDRMFYDKISKGVMVTVNLSSVSLTAMVTRGSVQSMALEPGEMVWVLFKASSFKWV
jgi:tungstate transport system ATP-binding protein